MEKEKKLTKAEREEVQLASHWNFMFKNAMVHKASETKRWNQYLDAYRGDYFKNKSLPDYKSNLVSNYIFSIVETIRPIMLDNDPKFQAMPRQPEGMAFSGDLQEVFSAEWDREKMNRKLYKELINTLVLGTSVFFVPWNAEVRNVNAIPVNPFNIFPDPLATSVDDAEYIIYASYKNDVLLKRKFPKKADKISGGAINYGELVQDNNRNAHIDNQVLILEVWCRDYTKDIVTTSGGEQVYQQRYPHGRVITLAPELGLVFSDKSSPYKDGKFPFVLIKDYDIPGKFWGEGEVAQLISPQTYMNELNNAIIDHAKTTANSPWILDKNSGIKEGSITSRQGLVIRKNPGSNVERVQPPSMPNYVINAVEQFKHDMEQVSGVFDTLKGNSETGVYTAQGILALQEAGQARVRLKVKLMEDALGELASLWYSRIKQYWKDERFIRATKHDGSYEVKPFLKETLEFDYDVKITAGSTMPVNRGAMLDLMVRLAQTQMPDGQMLVDREAVAQYLPEEVKSALLRRMNNGNVQLEQLQQQVEQLTQQLQQVAQQTEANDNETIGTIEDIASTIEQLNKKILQLSDNHAKLEEDKRKEEELNKIRTDSYNSGYADAEKLLTSDSGIENVTEGVEEGLPEDILQGLETLSDDELALLVEQNPDILSLIE